MSVARPRSRCVKPRPRRTVAKLTCLPVVRVAQRLGLSGDEMLAGPTAGTATLSGVTAGEVRVTIDKRFAFEGKEGARVAIEGSFDTFLEGYGNRTRFALKDATLR